MRLVLRIGGSVIASPINTNLISKYIDVLRELLKKQHEIAVVVGGGALARDFIKVAKDLALNEKVQDEAAISVSRIFGYLFVQKLGKLGCGNVSLTVEDAAKCLNNRKIAVMGGLKPGMTTDTVAALIAEETNADILIKATDQEGVYNKDPRKHSDAVMLKQLRFEDLPKVFAEEKHKAGIHQILDPEAVKILRTKKIKVVVVNGFKPENVLAIAEGKRIGTIVC